MIPKHFGKIQSVTPSLFRVLILSVLQYIFHVLEELVSSSWYEDVLTSQEALQTLYFGDFMDFLT